MNKLGDHIEYVKGFAFKSKDYTETGIPVIRVSNFTDNSIDIKDVYHIPKERFSEFQKVSLIKDDIVIATVGSWPTNPSSVVGKTIRVPPEANNTLLNQNAVRIRSLDKDEQLYFYYVLKDKSFSDYIISTAQGSANQASITLKSILDYDLPNIDSKEKRIKIGKTLATYDEKIQLNTQINQTLEQIAQALFKSWFVDFDPVRAKAQALSDGLSLEQAELAAMQAISGKTPEELTALSQTQPERYAELAETAKAFPCEMVEVDGVEVPNGWKVSTISECSLKIQNGGTPKRSNLEYWENGEISWLSSGEVCNNKVLVQSKEYITDLGLKGSAAKLIPPYSTLVAIYASPTAGKCAFSGFETSTNQAVCAIIPKEEYTFFNYYHLQLQEKYFANQASGSAQQNISKKIIEETPVLIPNKVILKKFNLLAKPIMNKTIENLKENNNLEKKRDLLLPKLLNGEAS